MKDHPLVRLLTDPAGVGADLARDIGDAFSAAKPWIAAGALSLALIFVVVAIVRAQRKRSHASGARRIAILPPPDVAANGALTLWMGLHAILRPAWRRLLSGQPHLAWEVVAEPDAIEIFLWVPRAVPPGLVERAVESAWPGARTIPGPTRT
ncbi:MAG: type VI secretion protein, partial [Chloroflexi bacterium]|nr:type VI secretion protein [Chloroflexota bacterium]